MLAGVGRPKSATQGKGTGGRNQPPRGKGRAAESGRTGLSQDGGFAGEGAELGGEGVEVVEAAVVAVGRDAGNGIHRVEVPWGEDEQ